MLIREEMPYAVRVMLSWTCKAEHAVFEPYRSSDSLALPFSAIDIASFDFLDYLRDSRMLPMTALAQAASLCRAARAGSLRVITHLHECHGWPLLSHSLYSAASLYNHAHVINYLRSRGFEPSHECARGAAQGGHLELLKHCIARRFPYNSIHLSLHAAKHHHWHILDYFMEERQQINLEAMTLAAMAGRLDVLSRLQAYGLRIFENVCFAAAENGHLDILKFAVENDCPLTHETCNSAARGGYIAIVGYLQELGMEWDPEAINEAAHHGHLDVVKYLHEHGCEWDEDVCAIAAEGCHLDINKYAHEHGCPWDEHTIRIAEKYGYYDIMAYARENGCPNQGVRW